MTTPGNSLNIKEEGFQSFDGVSVFKGRTLTAGTGISISNGTGVAGDPTITATTLGTVTSVTTSNATPQFILTGTVEDLDFGLTNLILGSDATGITSAGQNVALGLDSLDLLTSGTENTAIGYRALNNLTTATLNTAVGSRSQQNITTGATANTSIGYTSLQACTSGSNNTALGYSSLTSCSTGGNNVAVGHGALGAVATGEYNIGIGAPFFGGGSLTTSDSSNILIGHPGIPGDNNTIRIGSASPATANQTECYIAGIASVSTSNSEMVTIDTTTGQLGSTTIPSGTVTSVSGTANRITSTGGATPVIDIAATYVGQSSITTLGTIATGVWNGTDIALADGGTNASLTASNGGLFYSTATAGAILAGTATAGQIPRSGANSAPSWSTATYPATAGTSGNVLTSDGTNWVSQAPAAPTGAIYASGTLSNAQFKALNTSPLTIAAAPGAGSHYVVVSAGISLNYGGTNAFTSGGALQFQVNGTSQVAFSSTGYTGTVSSQSFGSPTNTTAGSFDNGVLRLIAATSDPGGNAANDNTVDWYCLYVLA
jgi:hypothetical protein